MRKLSLRWWRFALGLALIGFAWSAIAEDGGRPEVIHIKVDSIIHPVAAQFIIESIEEAERTNAEALVIELSTPGGLSASTDEIVPAMVNSEVPVVVFVSPDGARAASAGFFILMAADVAAMAPSTHTGSAAAVQADGSDIEGTMAEKIEEDSLASIRALATRYGRNVELAEATITEKKAYTAKEALDGGLIDLIAADLESLVEEIDGRDVLVDDQQMAPLQTADASLRELELSGFQRFLSAIAHPNIALLLMALGSMGLYFELSSPGAVLPGVIGAICLVLAFYSLSVLPVNYAGIALIALAMIFFIAEIKVVSFGLLTVAGVISLVIGSLMLFKSPDPAIRVSLDVIASVALLTVVMVGFLTFMVLRAHRQQVRTGSEGLINKIGIARTELSPHGTVFVHGELWNAVGEGAVESGDQVTVLGVDGLTLRVRGLAEPASERDPAEAET